MSNECSAQQADGRVAPGGRQSVFTDGAFRLHPVEADDASVTTDVRLGGDVDQLGEHVGRIVEVRGTYVQDTPVTTTPASFSVDRIKALTGTCPAK